MTCRYPYCDAGEMGAFCKDSCQQACPHGVDDGNCKECYEQDTFTREVCRHFNPVDLPCDECKVENAAAKERQFIINFLESMHERCLGRHNYYLHAAKLISNLPPSKST